MQSRDEEVDVENLLCWRMDLAFEEWSCVIILIRNAGAAWVYVVAL
jgi:hypothetical protein